MKTEIEWADFTWNVTGGCSELSMACTECYGKAFAWRHAHNKKIGAAYADLIDKNDEGRLKWTGQQALFQDRLARPYHWRKPRLIFVDSCADLFYSTPAEYLDRVFDVIRHTPRHFYLILTKYVDRMVSYMTEERYDGRELGDAWPPPNTGLGVTVEHTNYLDRLEKLGQIPRAEPYPIPRQGEPLRFVSYGPAIGPIAWPLILDRYAWLGWLIAEGQSGHRAAPSHPDWFRGPRDACAAASPAVPFFFKSWGNWTPYRPGIADHVTTAALLVGEPFVDGTPMFRVGKKWSGAELDGELVQQYPEVITRHFEEANR